MMDQRAISPAPHIVHRAGTEAKSSSKAFLISLAGLLCVVLVVQTNGGISAWDDLLQTYAIPRPIGRPIQTLVASPSPLVSATPQAVPVAQAYYYPIATAVPASAIPPVLAKAPKQALDDEPPAPAPEAAAPVAVPVSPPAPVALPPAPVAVQPVAVQPSAPQYAPPAYAQPPPSQYPQYPPQYGPAYGTQPQQPVSYGAYPPVQPGPATCSPCSNPTCDVGGAPGGCYKAIAAPPGYACECPLVSQHTLTQTPPPILGSAEWKELRSNQYGNPLAINVTEAETGMTIAKYEAGQVAYQLARYLKHKANMAKVQADIGNVILKDLKSVQPCRLVPGGPGGYRCAKSDDDDGDDETTPNSSPATAPGETPAAAPAKNGVFGFGFLGL